MNKFEIVPQFLDYFLSNLNLLHNFQMCIFKEIAVKVINSDYVLISG